MDKKKDFPQRYDAEVADRALSIAFEQVQLKRAQSEMAKGELTERKADGDEKEEKKAIEAEEKEGPKDGED